MGATTPHPPRHGGARRISLTAPDGQALAEQVRRVVMAASRGRDAAWVVELEGSPESVRYALESTSLQGRCAPPWHPGAQAATATVDAESAAALHDSWTPSLVLRMSTSDDGRRVSIRRDRAAAAEVETDEEQAAEVAAAAEATGPPQPAWAAAGDDAQPREPWPSQLWRRISARALVAAAGVAVVAVAMLVVVVWGPFAHRPPNHPGAPIPAQSDAVPLVSALPVAADPRGAGLVIPACCDAGGHTAVWTWLSGRWHHQPYAGPGPLFRRGEALVYDPDMHAVLLQGGDSSDETWAWDGTRWHQLHPEHRPPAGAAVAVYDDALRTVVLTLEGSAVAGGGSPDGYAWIWDGTDWSPVGRGPFFYGAVALGYDSVHGSVVALDESGSGQATTWLYDGRRWTHSDAPGPPSDPATELAWDARGQHLVGLLLGSLAQPLSGVVAPADTWSWDGTAWSRTATGPTPPVDGRLVDWLGTAVFLADVQTGEDVADGWTWEEDGWDLHAGGDGLDLRHPGETEVLRNTFLTVTRSAQATPFELGGAGLAAVSAAFAHLDAGEDARIVGVSAGIVRSGPDELCDCAVVSVLRTSPAACPGLEAVVQEAAVVVRAGPEPGTFPVDTVLVRPAPAGSVYGSCR